MSEAEIRTVDQLFGTMSVCDLAGEVSCHRLGRMQYLPALTAFFLGSLSEPLSSLVLRATGSGRPSVHLSRSVKEQRQCAGKGPL